jgi:ribosomal protein L29
MAQKNATPDAEELTDEEIDRIVHEVRAELRSRRIEAASGTHARPRLLRALRQRSTNCRTC